MNKMYSNISNTDYFINKKVYKYLFIKIIVLMEKLSPFVDKMKKKIKLQKHLVLFEELFKRNKLIIEFKL